MLHDIYHLKLNLLLTSNVLLRGISLYLFLWNVAVAIRAGKGRWKLWIWRLPERLPLPKFAHLHYPSFLNSITIIIIDIIYLSKMAMTGIVWQCDNDDKVMMTRLYEGTSASDTFDGRCVGHRLKVNFPPSWQKEFQIYSLKMKTHLEISNCRRNQAILYRLLTIRSNLP